MFRFDFNKNIKSIFICKTAKCFYKKSNFGLVQRFAENHRNFSSRKYNKRDRERIKY